MKPIKIFFSLIAAMILQSCATVYNTTSITVQLSEQIKVTHDLQIRWSIVGKKIICQTDSTKTELQKNDFQITDSALVVKDGGIFYNF